MENGETVSREDEHPQVIEEGPTLPALLSDDFVNRFEKGVSIYKRWVSVCYRLTRETHWIDHGKAGQPKYALQGPGAEALMNPLGISFEKPHIIKEEKHDGADSFYAFWCEGYMESRTLGRRGYYVGYCDSKDKFFNARSDWNPKTGEGDVKKSAMTNWIVNGVTRLAGLRDPDPQLLKDAGLDPTKITVIDYSSRKKPEDDARTISEAQGKRLWAICKQHGVTETQLRIHLSEKYKYTSSDQITRGNYDTICAWAQNPARDAGQQRQPGEEG